MQRKQFEKNSTVHRYENRFNLDSIYTYARKQVEEGWHTLAFPWGFLTTWNQILYKSSHSRNNRIFLDNLSLSEYDTIRGVIDKNLLYKQ